VDLVFFFLILIGKMTRKYAESDLSIEAASKQWPKYSGTSTTVPFRPSVRDFVNFGLREGR